MSLAPPMLGSAYPVVLWVRAGADAFEGISKISGPRNGGEREIELEREREREREILP